MQLILKKKIFAFDNDYTWLNPIVNMKGDRIYILFQFSPSLLENKM